MWCRTLIVVHVKLRSSGALMVNVPLRLWKCVVIALYLLLYGTAWSCTPRASDALQSGPWTDTERWQQTWRSGVDWIWFGKLKIRSSGCVAILWLKSSWQFWYKIDHWHQKWWIVCQTVYIFGSGEGAVRRGETAGGGKSSKKRPRLVYGNKFLFVFIVLLLWGYRFLTNCMIDLVFLRFDLKILKFWSCLFMLPFHPSLQP